MTKPSLVAWVLASIALLLSGCSSLHVEPEGSSDSSVLLSPATFNGQLYAQQLMSVDYDNQQHRLRMILEINPDKVTLVGLSGFSVPVFNIAWDGLALSSRSNLPADAEVLSAQRVIEDVMLALWPTSALDPLLTSKGWSLELDGVQRRFVDINHQPVMSIDYSDHQQIKGVIDVYYHDIGVGYQLETLQWDATYE
ncbi:DUF3261 domain-containing protein [Vibrio sp. WXL210]|uniref:DUF3261 domain-containing protein n=1 Tax=Vibrio sp. WXL210 TaxID=3450709 RepID=UPI003EC59C25